MKNFYDFRVWCENATNGIRFTPDRKTVYGELLDHLYDHYDALVSQGIDSKSAQKCALAAMGDAHEIAPQLAAIHRPFWGYCLRVTRVLLVLSLCAALLSAWFWKDVVYDYTGSFDGWNYDPYTETRHEGMYILDTRQFYKEVNQSQTADGTIFTLTQAALWHVDYTNVENDDHDYDHFYFQIEAFNPLPWTNESEAVEWIWAVDSLGNVYDSFHKGIKNYAPYVWVSSHHTGFLTYTYNFELLPCYCSQGAEWIEFHYDRSGRDLVWRIDLTGGDAA